MIAAAIFASVACLSAVLPSPAPTLPGSRDKHGKKRVLMLMCDTGGGHRASALALEAMMQKQTKNVEVKILDIWTEHGYWPDNRMPKSYRLLARLPQVYRFMYYASPFLEKPWFAASRLTTGSRFRRCIEEYDPDLVVSLHPLCQHLPLDVTRRLRDGSVPFATVCTDLGGAHPAWFVGTNSAGSAAVKRGVDACFVPSDAVRDVAIRRGVEPSKIFQFGLPVRAPFWKASARGRKPSTKRLDGLGLAPDKRTVLVMGGGDGVGSLAPIVEAMATRLAADHPGAAQVVAICGTNAKAKARLDAKTSARHWGDGVRVEVRGFTSEISEYMEAADSLVTKAGPGTIAEAAIRGLPTLISSFLPGQEWGNVGFVCGKGFGAFEAEPEAIARTVSGWLREDSTRLEEMARAARAAATPLATEQIAARLLSLTTD